MPHTNENPSQQNKEIMEKFKEKFQYGIFELNNSGYDGINLEIESFLLSALEQKDTEKERALKEQMDNFLNQKANQHDQMVREKALEDYKVGLMKKLDDILTLLK